MIGVASAVNALFEIYEFLIVVWCLISWIPRNPGGWIDDIASVVSRIVEPYMAIFRRVIPPIGGFDFSPVVAILVLSVIQPFVVGAIARI